MDNLPTEPEPGGGWISGPGNTPDPARAQQYNPQALVLDVLVLLKGQGFTFAPKVGRNPAAVAAAADLLTALGVDPSSAPQLPPKPTSPTR